MPPVGQLKQQRTVAFTLYYPSRALHQQCTIALVHSTGARVHEIGQSLALAPSSNGRCKISLRTSAVSWSEKSHCCPSIAVQLCMSLHTRPLPIAHCWSFRFFPMISRTSTGSGYFKLSSYELSLHLKVISSFVNKVSNENTIYKIIPFFS